MSKRFAPTNKWGQNQLEEYRNFEKHQYDEKLWIMKIHPQNYLLATFIQSTHHLPQMEQPTRDN